MQKQCDNVILELTVRNHPGVMTHVCGLFARRAFNVEGILCLPIQGSEHSRIWLLVNDDQRLGQMISQIEKLEDNMLHVRMHGQCSGCPSAELTLEELVSTELKEAFPERKKVVLVTGVSDDLIAQARQIIRQRKMSGR